MPNSNLSKLCWVSARSEEQKSELYSDVCSSDLAETQHNLEMLVFVMFQYTSYFLRVLSRLVKNELGETRTHDLPVKSRLLYQLSYQFVCGADLRLRLRLSVRQETSYLFTYSGMLLGCSIKCPSNG